MSVPLIFNFSFLFSCHTLPCSFKFFSRWKISVNYLLIYDILWRHLFWIFYYGRLLRILNLELFCFWFLPIFEFLLVTAVGWTYFLFSDLFTKMPPTHLSELTYWIWFNCFKRIENFIKTLLVSYIFYSFFYISSSSTRVSSCKLLIFKSSLSTSDTLIFSSQSALLQPLLLCVSIHSIFKSSSGS